MAKVIESKELKEKKSNVKALKLLIDKYIKTDKRKATKKIKKEQ